MIPKEMPKIPPGAKEEILATLSRDMKISVDTLVGILEKHGVRGDLDALQASYRKQIGQRLMASLRDEHGQRIVYCINNQSGQKEYVILDCCNDSSNLMRIHENLNRGLVGFNYSKRNVKERIDTLSSISERLYRSNSLRHKGD